MRRFLYLFFIIAVAVSAFPFTSSPAKAADPPFGKLADQVYFQQTGHHVSGAFLKYWWDRGGLDTYGFPLTEATEVNGLLTQYFERARFEYHPDNPDEHKVLLGLLGNEVTKGRKDSPFTPFPADFTYQNNKDRTYFPETGHFLSFGFKAYWEKYGGLAVFGFPISEEFSEKNAADGNTYTVQYFERARFEYHPEFSPTKYEVSLGLLGREIGEANKVTMTPVTQHAGTPIWPAGTVAPDKWIEINLSIPQTLTAWEGNNPVFSTRISGGLPAHPTPLGTFQVYWKLRYDDMTGGLAGTDDYYYLPNVPHVMYFYTGGYAIHGAYWHANFGYPISHGCVNLPLDAAEWVYNWSPVGTQIWIHY